MSSVQFWAPHFTLTASSHDYRVEVIMCRRLDLIELPLISPRIIPVARGASNLA